MVAYHPHYHHHHQHHQHQHHSVPRTQHHAVQHISSVANARPTQASSTLTLCERDMATATTSNGETAFKANDANAKHAESLQITLKDHPSMSFRNKGHVDIEVRYKPNAATKGKPMLEKIVVTESDKCPLLMDTKNNTKADAKVASIRAKKTLNKIEKPVSRVLLFKRV